MSRRRWIQVAIAVAVLALLAFGVTRGLERLFLSQPVAAPAEAAAVPDAAVAHITATLFYGSEDGQAIVGVRREVPLADGVIAQGRAILAAQVEAAPAPYLSVIPAGTVVRAFYVTARGDAFVDLSPEVTSAHPGGSLTELLTVSALVNAITANLPSIQRVQILVDGKQVDTLAGHVDLRRPLAGDPTLVRDQAAPQATAGQP